MFSIANYDILKLFLYGVPGFRSTFRCLDNAKKQRKHYSKNSILDADCTSKVTY